MSTLRLTGVGVDLPDGPLFDDVQLQLHPGRRLALVGENGAGKSTLLRVAAGLLVPDRGRVHRAGRVAYLAQALPDDAPAGSGGERQRRRLEAIRAEGADVLLLDEPTHHLDADAISWLEDWLIGEDAAVLFVAHDRALLDAVATDVAFLERGALRLEAGGYDEATARRAAADAAQGRRHRADVGRRGRLEAAVQREGSRARAFGAYDPRYAQGTSKLLAKNQAASAARTLARRTRAMQARLEREPLEEKPFDDRRRLSFVARPPERGPREVVTARDLVVVRGGRTLVAGLDLHVRRGERVALTGPNGSGKSTVLDVLTGRRSPDAGTVRLGPGLTVAHVDQTAEPWSGAHTVGAVLRRVRPDLKDGDVWRATAEAGVASDPERPVAELSGGERRRLTLACVAAADAHLLVLDEPTHHLDVRAVEALEALLAAYPGTLLLASHDRRLVARVATHVWRFTTDGGLDGCSVVPT
jgi:ATPase subunit of ABC transporter with duplicated ATPase domains